MIPFSEQEMREAGIVGRLANNANCKLWMAAATPEERKALARWFNDEERLCAPESREWEEIVSEGHAAKVRVEARLRELTKETTSK